MFLGVEMSDWYIVNCLLSVPVVFVIGWLEYARWSDRRKPSVAEVKAALEERHGRLLEMERTAAQLRRDQLQREINALRRHPPFLLQPDPLTQQQMNAQQAAMQRPCGPPSPGDISALLGGAIGGIGGVVAQQARMMNPPLMEPMNLIHRKFGVEEGKTVGVDET